MTKGLDNVLAKADEQTRDMRVTFLISEAIGIVRGSFAAQRAVQKSRISYRNFDAPISIG